MELARGPQSDRQAIIEAPDFEKKATGEISTVDVSPATKKSGLDEMGEAQTGEFKVVEKKDNRCVAIIFMNIFAISATGQGVIFKYVAKQGVSIIEYMFFRNFCIGTIAGMQLCYSKRSPINGIPPESVKDLIVRCIAGQVTFALINYTITLISMGTSLILFQTNPFWVSILACLLLSEKIKLVEILGIFVCFGGVIMIAFAKQQRISEAAEDTVDTEEDATSDSDQWLGIGLALLSAWTMGFNSVFTRKLKNINYTVVMTYHGLTGVSLALIYIVVERLIVGEFRMYTALQYLILTAAALTDTVCVNSMTIAYQSDSSGFVSLLGYTIVFYGFLADIVVFNEDIQGLELAGALLVLAATVVVAVIKLCQAYRQTKKTENEGNKAPDGLHRTVTIGLRARM